MTDTLRDRPQSETNLQFEDWWAKNHGHHPHDEDFHIGQLKEATRAAWTVASPSALRDRLGALREALKLTYKIVKAALKRDAAAQPAPAVMGEDAIKDFGLVPNEDKCSDRYFTKGETFLCQKPIGHGGWHESGDHEWQTVATSFCYMMPQMTMNVPSADKDFAQQARDEIRARLDEETAEQAIPPAVAGTKYSSD